MTIDLESITKQRSVLDSRGVHESITMLPKQIRHAWQESSTTVVPDHYKTAKSIVLFGMGGSALGMDIIQGVFSDTLTKPVLVVNGYSVPKYVDEDTLVILSSYSGTTEEVLTAAREVEARTKKVLVITTGGDLQTIAEKQQWPTYIINPKYNPCGQPRIAVGYAVIGLLGLLSRAGIMEMTDQVIDDSAHYLEGNHTLLEDEALRIVGELAGKAPLFIGSEFLVGNMHAVSNQTNENGKNFATYFALPELNHHLLEGLSFPAVNKDYLHFVFVESNLYHQRNQRRYNITKEILEKQHITHSTFVPTASTKLQQAFEVLQWGSYVSLYVAMYNQLDPSPIPWVDHLKNALA